MGIHVEVRRQKRGVRAKVRVVARVFSQREGAGFFEVYSPTPCAAGMHVFVGRNNCLDLCHLNAEHAFVRSELEE